MEDLETAAIERYKAASDLSIRHYGKPLMVCISGGKDSSAITELAIRSGIPCEFSHNHTTADAPETVRFVRQEFKRLEDLGYKCTINLPTYKGCRTSMWALIPQKLMPPTRRVRYCCSVLKEGGGAGRFIATGVRWAESTARKNNRGIYEKSAPDKENRIILNNDNDDRRLLFENCKLKAKRVVNPIIDWSDDDVKQFNEDAKKPLNPLYKCGFSRVGCIGCPMAGKHGREIAFSRWPRYKTLYINAFDRLLVVRKMQGKSIANWGTGTDVFNWWMEYDTLPGQIDLLDDYEKIEYLEDI